MGPTETTTCGNSHMSTPRHLHPFAAIELLEPRIAPATFVVTSPLDDNVTPGTLRDAITKANADPDTADTITFTNLGLPAGFHGVIRLDNPLLIDGPLTIKGPGSGKLDISGQGTVRIFFITDGDTGKDSPTVISGLSLIEGGFGTNGGAINSSESLTLSDVVVANSSVNNSGGGIYVDTPGKVKITGSAFLGNTGPNIGGGLYVSAAGGIVISKTTIADNKSNSTVGGAQLMSYGATGSISLDGVSVLRNSALVNGGGLWVDADPGRPISIKNSLIAGNVAGGTGGGLIRVDGALTVKNTVFSHNTGQFGGGLTAIARTDPITLTKVIFANNVSTDTTYGGGAIDAGEAALTISGSQFLHNVSAASGGGVWSDNPGTIKISSSLFAGNTADKNGGAIALDAATDLTLKSNVFSANQAVEGGAVYVLSGGTLTVTGGSFLDNVAAVAGGAIRTKVGTAGETVTITGALFLRNHSEAVGGAIFLAEGTAATVKASKFLQNIGKLGGGAIYLNAAATTSSLDIIGSLFSANAGDNGGALYAAGTATVNLTSSSLLGNFAHFATGKGGGIYLEMATVTLLKTKITANAANEGGGVFNDAGVVSYNPANTKITGNYASTGPDTSGV